MRSKRYVRWFALIVVLILAMSVPALAAPEPDALLERAPMPMRPMWNLGSAGGIPMADFQQVRNPDVLTRLTDRQRATIEKNGFVVVPDNAPQLFTIYQEATRAGTPVFVTTDAILHTFHILYDYALRQAEMQYFVPALRALVPALMQASLVQAQSTTGDVQAAAWDNVAFFGVAARLLDPNTTIPPKVEETVQAELKLISAHAALAKSPLFGYREYYSQYIPRGHYTRNETFARYFQAMMWFGRMSFRLRPTQDESGTVRGRHFTRQALLLLSALKNTQVEGELAWTVWERIYKPTAFFVGRSDDLSVYDYDELSKRIYGEAFTPADLRDDAQLDRFVAAALEAPSPQIVSAPVTDRENPAIVTKGLRFMGQRFVFDSYIFQQLVFDQVGLYRGTGKPFTLVLSLRGPIRGFPRGLDVAAVFGSERALEILKAEGDADYEGYNEQVTTLRKKVKDLPTEQWKENLYWGWLHSLQPLLSASRDELPKFMRTMAWLDKDLHTFLGSWTELRHDTILYAKQSSTIKATSIQKQPQLAKGYVEPQPEVYARLSALAEQTIGGLQAYGVLDAEVRDKLTQLKGLTDSLRSISEQELKGAALSAADYQLIRDLGSRLESLVTFSVKTEKEVASETDRRMAIVTDVHTDPNSQQVLEEGIGNAFRLYVVVEIDGQPTATVGGVYSYYEFRQPMSDRLTDEAWQAREELPSRPTWTASFIVE